jgi:NAD(P)-dependent dehydrogenase (short-subunit alcohol dehydrogenase family)
VPKPSLHCERNRFYLRSGLPISVANSSWFLTPALWPSHHNVRSSPNSRLTRATNSSSLSAASAASKWALEALSECLAQEMRAFDVRVVIVEPGVIATPILTKGYPIPAGGPYPHARRIAALFAARLANHTPPSVVGDLIRDIPGTVARSR